MQVKGAKTKRLNFNNGEFQKLAGCIGNILVALEYDSLEKPANEGEKSVKAQNGSKPESFTPGGPGGKRSADALSLHPTTTSSSLAAADTIPATPEAPRKKPRFCQVEQVSATKPSWDDVVSSGPPTTTVYRPELVDSKGNTTWKMDEWFFFQKRAIIEAEAAKRSQPEERRNHIIVLTTEKRPVPERDMLVTWCCAKEIWNKVCDLHKCVGCEVDHPSHIRHMDGCVSADFVDKLDKTYTLAAAHMHIPNVLSMYNHMLAFLNMYGGHQDYVVGPGRIRAIMASGRVREYLYHLKMNGQPRAIDELQDRAWNRVNARILV